LFDLAAVHGGVPVRVAEFEAILAERLLACHAPHLQQHRVGVGETVIQVEHVGQVGRVRQHGFVEPAFAFGCGHQRGQFALGVFVARLVFLFAQVAFGEQGDQVGEIGDLAGQCGARGARRRKVEGEGAEHASARQPSQFPQRHHD